MAAMMQMYTSMVSSIGAGVVSYTDNSNNININKKTRDDDDVCESGFDSEEKENVGDMVVMRHGRDFDGYSEVSLHYENQEKSCKTLFC